MIRPNKKQRTVWFYCVDVDEYQRDVEGLTVLERGVHDALRTEYFRRRGPLPDSRKDLYRLAGAFDKQERRAVDAVLEKRFSLEADGLWHNARCDAELERINAKQAVRSVAGTAGAMARWGSDGKRMANASDCHSNANGKLMPLSNEDNEDNKGNERNIEKELSPPSFREGGIDVPRNIPAPPNGTGKVGADIRNSLNISSTRTSSASHAQPVREDRAQSAAAPRRPRPAAAWNLPPEALLQRMKTEGKLFVTDDELLDWESCE